MAQLSGRIEFDASVNRARKAMPSLATLLMFLDADSLMTPNETGGFDFVITRDVGVLTIRLPGSLATTEDPGSTDLRFIAMARHPLAGSALVDFVIRFEGDHQHCALSYEGRAEATGLLGAYLVRRIDRVASHITRIFTEIGRKHERNQRSYEARIAAEAAAAAKGERQAPDPSAVPPASAG